MSYKSKEDQRKAAQKHYQANKKLYKQRAVAAKRKALARNRKAVLEFLQRHPCVDCEESNPIVLEFDHRKEEEKLKNIADMVQSCVSLSKLEKEILKCDVRCANCHRLKTAREENWWIYRHAVEQLGSSPGS